MSSQELEFCTWADFSLTDIEKLLRYSSNSECIRKVFCQKFDLEAVGNQQHQILLDLYTYTLLFGQKHNCTPAQLSTILSIVKGLHAKCASTALENQDEVLTFFQETMVKHSVNRPPFSHCIFSPCQVKSITEYVLSTYFKHFKLYKYVFTKQLQLNVALDYVDENETIEELKQQTDIVAEGGSEIDANIEPDSQISEVTQPTDQIGKYYIYWNVYISQVVKLWVMSRWIKVKEGKHLCRQI